MDGGKCCICGKSPKEIGIMFRVVDMSGEPTLLCRTCLIKIEPRLRINEKGEE